jgi:polysaccharide export outer membrane protein
MAGLAKPLRPGDSAAGTTDGGQMRATLNKLWSALLILAVLGVAHADEPLYTVKAGDVLAVAVWKEPDLTSNAVLVRPDGTFSFPLVGQIDARAKTVQELQNLITERLRKYIADPVVTVSVQEVKGNKVYVIGQVTKPGDFVVNPNVNVMQALSMAGGGTPFASLNNIIILRRTPSGQVALPFHYNDVVHAKDLQQNVELQAGDIVVVP